MTWLMTSMSRLIWSTKLCWRLLTITRSESMIHQWHRSLNPTRYEWIFHPSDYSTNLSLRCHPMASISLWQIRPHHRIQETKIRTCLGGLMWWPKASFVPWKDTTTLDSMRQVLSIASIKDRRLSFTTPKLKNSSSKSSSRLKNRTMLKRTSVCRSQPWLSMLVC